MDLRLKQICEQTGITRSQIQEATGLKKGYLSDLFNGKCNPTLETLEKIAKALDVNIVELFPATSTEQLIALISHRNEFYKATTLKELEEIVEKIKANKDDNK